MLLTFGASCDTDFSDATGEAIELQIGEFRKSLKDMGAWPPRETDDGSCNYQVAARLPLSAFQCGQINWIQLHQNSPTTVYLPCVPAVMDPYINPLREG